MLLAGIIIGFMIVVIYQEYRFKKLKKTVKNELERFVCAEEDWFYEERNDYYE